MLFNGLIFFYGKKLLYFFNNKNIGIFVCVLFIVMFFKLIGEYFCKKKNVYIVLIFYIFCFEK